MIFKAYGTCHLITFTLVITGLAIGLWTSRLLNIDVITTILGAAPGGISSMIWGSEYGVGAAVATLHGKVNYCTFNSSISCEILKFIWVIKS